MKILSLHCDFIKFKPLKKALKEPEEITDEQKESREIKDPLVILTAVEKRDEPVVDIAEKLVNEVKGIAKQVDAKTIVLYPYAHLSSSLSAPDFALKTLQLAETRLKEQGFEVSRAPFGYYKEFELKCKGHPLSELSREIIIEEGTGEVEEIEDRKRELSPEERGRLLKQMSKVKMSVSEKAEGGLKSNIELGRDLDLYIVSEIVGQGLPLLTPKGTTIKREIERFVVDEELKRGYLHTSTPIMAKSDLYKISGHWQHYKDLMFSFKVGDETFALRPMTCPFQFIIYKSKSRSYKELPIKYAEISNLFRNEKSGELMGLTRLRQFTLADAHIICRPDQLEEEFKKVVDLIQYVMKTLKIDDVWYRFSKWDPKNKEKYIDNPKAWEESQKSMKKILNHLKIKYKEADNEAAFYGPKLDIQFKNIFGKEDTLITVQIDFALPERYDMTYIDENNQQKRPMIIHRSSLGCTERTIAYLLEKTQGHLPLWLAPVQCRVINFTDRNNKACRQLHKELEELGFRTDLELSSEPLGGKIKQAETEKIPYILVIGDKEEKSKSIAVRHKGKVTKEKIKAFIKKIQEEVEKKK
jgi:threonyl-tRNA synthetase